MTGLVPLAEWLPAAPAWVFVFAAVVLLLAYTVFGATGFGSSIIAVPMLAHFFPLTFAVPLVTTVDVTATMNASLRQWRHARRDELARIIPALLIGSIVGTSLLVRLPRGPALIALGVFVTLYGVYLLARPRRRALLGPRWSWPIGMLGGVFSVLFGTGGPIYMVYLSARIADKTELRATSSVLIATSVLIRILVFVVSGLLLQRGLLLLAAALVPAMLIGYVLGNRLHHALSHAGVVRLIALLLAANGMSLLVRALGAT